MDKIDELKPSGFSFNPRPACRANGACGARCEQYDPCFNPRPACRANGEIVAVACEEHTRFNPRPACRANARRFGFSATVLMFQSAPCVQGECRVQHWPRNRAEVSIRALRAGRMPSITSEWNKPRRFNPRPACRANASVGRPAAWDLCFNPRPACRANARIWFFRNWSSKFQSAPCVQGEWS